MIRSFVVALVTIACVSALGLDGEIAAQPATAKPVSFPMDFTGAKPGTSIELYMNITKMADIAVPAGGQISWLLDMGNIVKTRIQVYVDVCQDGKVVKVLVVSGQPPPEDDNCNRRLVIAGFWSDCGVMKLTIDLTRFGGSVVGCSSPLTRPQVYGPLAAGAVLLGVLGGGGGDSTPSLFSSTPFVPPTTPTNTTVAAPPAPVPTTPVAPTPPPDFVVSIPTFTSNHPTGANTSLICGLLTTNPFQPGAAYTVQSTGAGVISGQNVSGVLNPNGQAAFEVRISQFGPYTVVITVTSTGMVQRTATSSTMVTSGNNTCPRAQ